MASTLDNSSLLHVFLKKKLYTTCLKKKLYTTCILLYYLMLFILFIAIKVVVFTVIFLTKTSTIQKMDYYLLKQC